MMAHDIRGWLGPKFFWHLSYGSGKPRKTSSRKTDPTGCRTRARCERVNGITLRLQRWSIIWNCHYRHHVFFVCSSSERSVNYVTKMACMLLSSTCEEQRSVVWVLWTKGHNLSEIHRDMCGVYGEDCLDRSNVSRLFAFFKAAIPWRMRTAWRRYQVVIEWMARVRFRVAEGWSFFVHSFESRLVLGLTRPHLNCVQGFPECKDGRV